VTLIGATPENGRKLLLTLAVVVAMLAIGWLVRAFLSRISRVERARRVLFWGRQVVNIALTLLLLIGVLSIWFDDPNRLATAAGLVTAGLAFALQRVITATAGYFVILRGKTFNVGDRIVMGGVRGDVIDLSFMQTRIMEMGQSPKEQGDAPSMWIRSRQFTGRIVTVTNDKVFDEPVYNYTKDFPYIWDEINLPVRYQDDRAKAEQILLDAARKHALTLDKIGEDEVKRLDQNFGLDIGQIDPHAFWRITDNWLEITVRFLAPDHGIRQIKDKMSRDILAGLDKAKITVASSTHAIVEVPPIKLESAQPA
jgi:small-conductance mechanosensitive channel